MPSIAQAVSSYRAQNTSAPPPLTRETLFKGPVKAQYTPYSNADQFSLRSQIDHRIRSMVELPVALNTQSDTTPLKNVKQSALFHNTYRNFDLLPARTQKTVLTKLNLFIDKYPDFLERLNNVDNPMYGKGFQFYFVPPENNERWQDIPTAVRGTGGATEYIGIVHSHPVINALPEAGVVGMVRKAMNYTAIGMNHVIGRVSESKPNLDVGGMMTDVSADTFTHEMGHIMHSYVMSNEEKLEIWAIYSEAESSGEGFISDYSKTNHFEFFAEGVEAYMYQNYRGEFSQRDSLKTKNPKLHNFVERMIEPGVKRTSPDSLFSTWAIAKAKASNAAEAVKNLGLDTANKKACKCAGH